MAGFFICYRRNDSGEVVGRLYDRLVQRFGTKRVFKDVFSIAPGRDFQQVIDEALGETDAMLVVIGDRWDVARLTDPEDPVRREIERALAANVQIIPLFIRGATMPRADELPPAMEPFVRRNGIPLREDPDFERDVSRVVDELAGKSQRVPVARILVPIAGVAVVAAIAWYSISKHSEPEAAPATSTVKDPGATSHDEPEPAKPLVDPAPETASVSPPGEPAKAFAEPAPAAAAPPSGPTKPARRKRRVASACRNNSRFEHRTVTGPNTLTGSHIASRILDVECISGPCRIDIVSGADVDKSIQLESGDLGGQDERTQGGQELRVVHGKVDIAYCYIHPDPAPDYETRHPVIKF